MIIQLLGEKPNLQLINRKLRKMLSQQLNEVLMSEDGNNVPLSIISTNETEMNQKRKESQEMPKKKKAKLEWRPEDCAQPLGDSVNSTGEGDKKKFHYLKFEFRGIKYEVEDTVLLVPEENKKPYVAIIKDIYVQGKEGYVKLQVQWFYRPEDVEKKYVGKLESEDSKDLLFFSFHRDEVFAESVKHQCLVYFIPEDKQISNRAKHSADFIVQKVYVDVKKKLKNFTDKGFDVQQKFEIDLLVAKTISQVGEHANIEEVQMTKISRRKRSVPKRLSHLLMRAKANSSNDESIMKMSQLLHLDRDKTLQELMEAVKHMCKEKQAGDSDNIYWPNDVVPVVRALEQALYDSFADNIPNYIYKLGHLVEKLKNSRVLARRLLNGELKPEQAIKMKPDELMRGWISDEIKADLKKPILVENAASTSNVGPKDSLKD